MILRLLLLLLLLPCLLCNAAAAFMMGGGKAARIPKSSSDRDNQAIAAIQAALSSPRVPSVPLVECEFPAVAQLNKLGDGSLQSSNQVDQVNLQFCKKLIQQISPPLPFLGPQPWLLVSTGASNAFLAKAKATKLQNVHSLRQGLPKLSGKDPCVLCSPSSRADYDYAKQLAQGGYSVVIVNGLAKDQKSIPSDATMAYYCKPLTYNSQIAGYLVRCWPGEWTTMLNAATGKVLGTFSDEQILVPGTNTPDLRAAVKQVQLAADERAIAARHR